MTVVGLRIVVAHFSVYRKHVLLVGELPPDQYQYLGNFPPTPPLTQH